MSPVQSHYVYARQCQHTIDIEPEARSMPLILFLSFTLHMPNILFRNLLGPVIVWSAS